MLLKGTPGGRLPLLLPASTASTRANKTGSWRFLTPAYREKTGPCRAACPTGEDIARVQMLTARGEIDAAWETIAAENPFPAVCGRVCFHPCESACNRTGWDEAVAVRQVERAVGDAALNASMPLPAPARQSNGVKIAIAGAGPSGLSAAYFLARLGYACDIFEAREAPGGVMRWGIPAYRLPKDILAAEIRRILETGGVLRCGSALRLPLDAQIRRGYDALFIGCGHGKSVRLKIAGDEHAADGLEMLNRINSGRFVFTGGRIAVIGGGNTAVDVARSLLRLGAEPVVVYRRRRKDMPAFGPEVSMALEEGVQLIELASPVRIEPALGKAGGYRITLQKMTAGDWENDGRLRVAPSDGQTVSLKVNRVVTAIGAEAAQPWLAPEAKNRGALELSHCLLLEGPLPTVFGGDLSTPYKSVADAIASGKQAAMALDTFLREGMAAVANRLSDCRIGSGPALSMSAYLAGSHSSMTSHTVPPAAINLDYFEPSRRSAPRHCNLGKRRSSFSEVEATFDARTAGAEAGRCFNCGICNDCDNCRLYCPETAVLLENARRRIDLDFCKGCGVCVEECPRNAMSMEE